MSNAGFNKLVRVQEVSNTQKFVAFNLGGITDTIMVGLTFPELPLDDPHQCLSIAYKGENIIIPFTAMSKDIEDINKGIPSQVEVDLYVKEQLNKFNTQNGVK
jgi:hypothetical protein